MADNVLKCQFHICATSIAIISSLRYYCDRRDEQQQKRQWKKSVSLVIFAEQSGTKTVKRKHFIVVSFDDMLSTHDNTK